jgi:predicted GNAT family N-acyltransferase
MTIEVVELAAHDTHHLRRTVLRDHLPGANVTHAADEAPGTFHLGVRGEDGEPAAVATFSIESGPITDGRAAVRLRGMAVAADRRSEGLGRAVVAAALDRLRADGVEVCWANARSTALDFYLGLGFTAVGDEFDSVGIPHRLVVLDL